MSSWIAGSSSTTSIVAAIVIPVNQARGDIMK
jgi:hypothetical protein